MNLSLYLKGVGKVQPSPCGPCIKNSIHLYVEIRYIESLNMKHETIIKIGALIEKNGKLLLIKEKGWQDTQYHWNIIKGTFEPRRDKDLFQAVLREAREEANASITIKGLLNILYLKKHHRSLIQFNFVADLVGSHYKVSRREDQKKYRRDEEVTDVKLFTKKDLKRMKRREFIGERTYYAIQQWLRGKRYPARIVQTLQEY